VNAPSYAQFKDALARAKIGENDAFPDELHLFRGGSGAMKVIYAPLDFLPSNPQLALIGITPGATQARLALNMHNRLLGEGVEDEQAQYKTKLAASFGGDMRQPLVDMLDRIGINRNVGLQSCADLWTERHGMRAAFTSLLRYPTFHANGRNYAGIPTVRHSDAFKTMLELTTKTLNDLPTAAQVVPLGQRVAKALGGLEKAKALARPLIRVEGEIVYFPHPSGANGEGVQLVLEWRHRSASEYASWMYSRYLAKSREEGRHPSESPEQYKAKRVLRYHAVRRLREFYGVRD
jgi:hypothetical protein